MYRHFDKPWQDEQCFRYLTNIDNSNLLSRGSAYDFSDTVLQNLKPNHFANNNSLLFVSLMLQNSAFHFSPATRPSHCIYSAFSG
ncbi:hypothetical protein SAMN05518672_108185 [Chitinophaga sp. CF118]|nr:hypothetical protein SAMN05518672_108185 [Chitinophaga sp. CF118]